MQRPSYVYEKPFVNQFAILEVRDSLQIPVLITDYRNQYGHPQVKFIPLVGDGGYWTYAEKIVTILTPSDIWNRYLKGVAISCDGQQQKSTS